MVWIYSETFLQEMPSHSLAIPCTLLPMIKSNLADGRNKNNWKLTIFVREENLMLIRLCLNVTNQEICKVSLYPSL